MTIFDNVQRSRRIAGVGVQAPCFDQFLGDAFRLVGLIAELAGWGERAEDGVGGDFFDGCGWVLEGRRGRCAGQVRAGDLQAVEQQPGAFGVDVVGRDALQHLGNAELDAAAVFRFRQRKAGVAAAAA